MSNVIINDVGAVEQPKVVSYIPSRGFTTTRRFKGQKDGIQALANQMIFEGYEVTMTEGPVFELEARCSWNASSGGSGSGQVEAPVDTWELMANVSEKDLLQSDQSAVLSIPRDDLAFLRDVADGKVDMADYKDTEPAMSSAAGLAIFRLLIMGVKSVTNYSPVLRHTRTVSWVYDIPNSITGWGKVYSAARLISENGVPTNISSQMGVSSRKKISDNTVEVYNGWLKTFPQIVVSAYSKSQIVNEWQYGDWSTTLYEIVE